MLLDDSPDSPSLTSDEEDQTLKAGDYVVDRFAGKKRTHYYIGQVVKLDDCEVEARFLPRIRSTHGSNRRPTFVFNEKDEAVLPRQDVLILPHA
ncbi:hypothetical protein PBY51_007253 [Eleginops maclovinus]|uniref:Uncharacterized protein n=1 Tax=Eleginops maclovinus TaxID=56733 RepID=A0AAN7X8T0_ELEMC|nr:hypothetical protein PBY51_007253 [Eleginops maclovinus]